MPDHLTEPHGGELCELLMGAEEAEEARARSREWPSWTLGERQLCDLELLLTGAFSPLRGFLGRADYERVCAELRLESGLLWPIPIVLDVTEELAAKLEAGSRLALRDDEGVMLAELGVDEVWRPDRAAEAEAVYGTASATHPGVAHLLERTHAFYVGGRVRGIALPSHYDFRDLRLTPRQLREDFARRGWRRVVAFQTRTPIHRAQHEITLRAIREAEANLLIHPAVGITKPGDLDHYTRVRCYKAVLEQYPPHVACLALLPLAMRMAGPREALWHAIIRRNCGCTHLIVGRDHAGPGSWPGGAPIYGPYEAQELLRAHEEELGVRMVPFREVVYVPERDAHLPVDEVPEGARVAGIGEDELARRLADDRAIPAWFTHPGVAAELRRRYRPRHQRGFTVFFTGLSGAGKSTLARVLLVRLLEAGGRPVTLLDGDIVRRNLSSELGFSKEHRDLNIRRIGFVASEITKNGGIAICAPIAPYDRVRREVRELIEPLGGFVLVHVATPLEVCEERDRKGLYAKARAGIIAEFTGISDPYEVPGDADVAIDTADLSPEEGAQRVILHLMHEGYLGRE